MTAARARDIRLCRDRRPHETGISISMREICFPYPFVAPLCLRLTIAAVFGWSGWSDLHDTDARSRSLGMDKPFAIHPGAAELAGALGVASGRRGPVVPREIPWTIPRTGASSSGQAQL